MIDYRDVPLGAFLTADGWMLDGKLVAPITEFDVPLILERLKCRAETAEAERDRYIDRVRLLEARLEAIREALTQR